MLYLIGSKVAAPPKRGLLPDRVLPPHPIRRGVLTRAGQYIARFCRGAPLPSWSRLAGGILINHSCDVERRSRAHQLQPR
jgi:hypothetical protein